MPWVKVDTSTHDDSQPFDPEFYLTEDEAHRGFLIEWAPDGMGFSEVALYKWLDGYTPRSPGFPQMLLQSTPAHPAFGHRPDAETHQLDGSVREPIDLARLRDQSRE